MTDKRKRILKAAVGLFMQKGYGATTMDQIAVRSRIAKGTLYLYFKDKADLYVSLLEERIDALQRGLAEVAGTTAPPARRLALMIRSNLEYIANEYSGAEFIADTSAGHDPELLKLIRARITPRFEGVLRLLAGVIGEGVKTGSFRRIDPFETAARIFGLVNINLMRRALDTKPIEPETEAKMLSDLIFNGIAAHPDG